MSGFEGSKQGAGRQAVRPYGRLRVQIATNQLTPSRPTLPPSPTWALCVLVAAVVAVDAKPQLVHVALLHVVQAVLEGTLQLLLACRTKHNRVVVVVVGRRIQRNAVWVVCGEIESCAAQCESKRRPPTDRSACCLAV